MSKRVLLVTSGRLAAYRWRRGQIAEPMVFQANEDGLGQFAQYLDDGLDEPVYILVDLVEEEFREDTIPHVLGADRRALVQTKLNRLFRDTTYSQALFQGRETGGRRDDRVLFTALIRPDLLAPWIGQITRHKLPLAGIYSLPIVSQMLLRPLQVDSAHALVVTMQSAGALRQTFFLGRNLKVSRLAVMPQLDPRGYASYVLGEIEKIRRYLNSLRLLPPDNPLDVYVIGDESLLEDVKRQSPDSLTTRHHLVTLNDVAQKVGLGGPYRSVFADRIYAHLLARRPPANQYAQPSQTRYFTLHRTRAGLKAASALILAAGVVVGGAKLFEGISTLADTELVKKQFEFYDRQYSRARERLPATPADSREMRLAVETARTVAAYKTGPLPLLVVLSDGLRAFPALQVDQVDWRASTNPTETVGGGRSRSGGAIAAIFGSGSPEPSATLYQLARVRGRIDPFNGDYRGALELVSRFAEHLRTLPAVHEVQVVSLPLDIGSDQRLAGDASVEATLGSAPFELRVVIVDRAGPEGGGQRHEAG